jgi:hypothetical protein
MAFSASSPIWQHVQPPAIWALRASSSCSAVHARAFARSVSDASSTPVTSLITGTVHRTTDSYRIPAL